jgi:putative ABC transport system substrate-binding protein
MAYPESDPEGHALVAAFRDGLRKLGWLEGRNVQVEIRWATPDVTSMQRFARELVALQPSLLLSQNTPTTASVLQQTSSIPVIFATVSDPVGSGFVASLAPQKF